MLLKKRTRMNQNGITSLSYRSIDLAGNVETTKTLILKVDTTAPSITVTGIVYNPLSNDEDVLPVITLDDNASGVDTSKTQVALDLNSYNPGAAIALYTLPLGSHTLTVHASDLADKQAIRLFIRKGNLITTKRNSRIFYRHYFCWRIILNVQELVKIRRFIYLERKRLQMDWGFLHKK